MQVLNTLKPGLNEKAYENALVIEQIKPGHAIEQQRRFDVLYEGQLVDTLIPNLLVDGLVVVIHKGGFRFHENPPYPDDGQASPSPASDWHCSSTSNSATFAGNEL